MKLQENLQACVCVSTCYRLMDFESLFFEGVCVQVVSFNGELVSHNYVYFL